MPSKVNKNTRLRPILSPYQPNRIAPSGRNKNPIVKTAIVLSSPATGSSFAKKCVARIDAKLPKM